MIWCCTVKVALFKIKSTYTASPTARAVLFHGDVTWFVDYSAKTFAKSVGLSVDPVVHVSHAKDFFSEAQQATFFSHEGSAPTMCLISGVESGTMTIVKPLLANLPDGMAVVMISHAYLRPSSGVRKHFEKEEDCLIVPVFTPTGYQINQYIQSFFQEKGLRIEREAVHILAQNVTHFIDKIDNVLEVIALYHGDQSVTASGVKACLSAAHIQPDVIRVVLAFFLCKQKDFFESIKSFDLQDTAELLFFLRLLQDAALTILLSKESLLSPSDARAIKWQALLGSGRLWERKKLARILAWILRAEVSAKKQMFFQEFGFLFQFFIK